MKFSIEVGTVEKQEIEYHFNQLLGQLVIKLNQKEVRRNVRLFKEPKKESHVVPLEDGSRSAVRIERERLLFFGQKCRVFLNERLYKCYIGL